jgi:hypothetical protein
MFGSSDRLLRKCCCARRVETRSRVFPETNDIPSSTLDSHNTSQMPSFVVPSSMSHSRSLPFFVHRCVCCVLYGPLSSLPPRILMIFTCLSLEPSIAYATVANVTWSSNFAAISVLCNCFAMRLHPPVPSIYLHVLLLVPLLVRVFRSSSFDVTDVAPPPLSLLLALQLHLLLSLDPYCLCPCSLPSLTVHRVWAPC